MKFNQLNGMLCILIAAISLQTVTAAPSGVSGEVDGDANFVHLVERGGLYPLAPPPRAYAANPSKPHPYKTGPIAASGPGSGGRGTIGKGSALSKLVTEGKALFSHGGRTSPTGSGTSNSPGSKKSNSPSGSKPPWRP